MQLTTVMKPLFMLRLKQLDLLPALQYLEDHNPAKDLPYHNNTHAFWTAYWADRFLDYYHTTDHRTVVVAALFHDFDHSGGTDTDEVNIERAIAGVEGLFASGVLTEIDHDSEQALDLIRTYIRSTHYPRLGEPKSVTEQTLWDADALSALLTDVSQVMEGLRQELSLHRDTELTYRQMLDLQRQYMDSVKVWSIPAKMLWNEVHGHVWQTQTEYVECRETESDDPYVEAISPIDVE